MTTKFLYVPAYQLHKASGQARVKINGRDHYLGPYETLASEQAYNRLLAQYYQHGQTLPPQEAYTIGHLIVDYMRHATGYYADGQGKPTKQLANIKIALRPLAELFSEIDATDFKPRDLATVRQVFIDLPP